MESHVGQSHRFVRQQLDIHRSHQCEHFAEYHWGAQSRMRGLGS